jgi:hypothetical protein
MDFANGIMLQLESISVILNYNLSICWWNDFATNIHLWMVVFCTY